MAANQNAVGLKPQNTGKLSHQGEAMNMFTLFSRWVSARGEYIHVKLMGKRKRLKFQQTWANCFVCGKILRTRVGAPHDAGFLLAPRLPATPHPPILSVPSH